jgi:hypothetical protein
MADYSVEVMLQFPAMPAPYQVRLSPRQVRDLDRETEWRFAPDGTVIYDHADRRHPGGRMRKDDGSALERAS